MIAVQFLTSDDVLARALELIAAPLPHEWATCQYELGPHCTRCAAAHATSELTTDMHFDAGDDALRMAAIEIRSAGDAGRKTLSQAEAEAILTAALARARKRLAEA